MRTKAGEELVLRISPEPEGKRLACEAWALRECRDAGVPVPEVLLIETLKDPSVSICIQRRVPGRPLEEVVSGGLADAGTVATLLRQAGELLSRIHTVRTSGIGWISEPGVGCYRQVREWVDVFVSGRERLLSAAQASELEPVVVDEALELMVRRATILEVTSPRLVHNDFAPKHIFVDGTTISGIIDMESSWSGDPAGDLASWDFFHGRDLPVALLEKGYSATPLDGSWEERKTLLKLQLALRHLHYFSRRGMPEAVQYVWEGLVETLADARRLS